ncbi:MAG: hypothetical protein GKS07_09320 [Nitrosopumilus sp.]|nr:MAG: hypothetical protein GKS07_09320 [Nitrosopumilus sp.]
MMMDVPRGSSMPEMADPVFKAFKVRTTFQDVCMLDDLKKEITRGKRKSGSWSS